MSETRRESRIKAILTVRIARMQAPNGEELIIAHTYDISRGGIRIGGLRGDLSVGEIVTLKRKDGQAEFSVCWKGEDGVFGLRSLEPDKDIWDLGSEFEARKKERLAEENDLKSPETLRWETARIVRSVQ
jgi:hypothetical protein